MKLKFKQQEKIPNCMNLLCGLLLTILLSCVPAIFSPAHAAAPLADLAIVKTVDDATPQEGDSIIYTLTLTNNGPGNAAQLEVTDLLPTGVTYVSDDGAGSYDNATGLWTPPGQLSNGASVTLNITATVDAGTAGSTITNTATVTDSNRIDPDATNDTSSVDIDVVEANLTVLKSALTTSLADAATNQYNIPGATVLYSITVTNTGLGTADNNSVFVSDPIPANTELFVGDLSLGSPVVSIDGTPASGLTIPISFISLGDLTDDIEFSNDNGTSWTYAPVADADGYDATVTNIRVNPKGTFAASDGTNHPSFILRFQVRVQ